MTTQHIDKILGLSRDAFDIYERNLGNKDLSYINKIEEKLTHVDAIIYHETKPRYIPTSEGWDIMLSNSTRSVKKAPTRESIKSWLKSQSLL